MVITPRLLNQSRSLNLSYFFMPFTRPVYPLAVFAALADDAAILVSSSHWQVINLQHVVNILSESKLNAEKAPSVNKVGQHNFYPSTPSLSITKNGASYSSI